MEWTSVISICISLFALVVSAATFIMQRKYNKNFFMPILNIDLGDFEDSIYVRFVNNGVGPAIITSIEVSYVDETNETINNSLMKTMIDEKRVLDTFNCTITGEEDLIGHAMSPGAIVFLLKIDNIEKEDINDIRMLFKGIKVLIKYKDLRGDSYDVTRTLDYFC